jgi:hypothetical protein
MSAALKSSKLELVMVPAIVISLSDKNPETTFISEVDVPETSKNIICSFRDCYS